MGPSVKPFQRPYKASLAQLEDPTRVIADRRNCHMHTLWPSKGQKETYLRSLQEVCLCACLEAFAGVLFLESSAGDLVFEPSLAF